jgi:hypothetical protein
MRISMAGFPDSAIPAPATASLARTARRAAIVFALLGVLIWAPTIKIAYYVADDVTVGLDLLDIALLSGAMAGLLTLLLLPLLWLVSAGRLVVALAIALASAAIVNAFMVPSPPNVLEGGVNMTLPVHPWKLAITGVFLTAAIALLWHPAAARAAAGGAVTGIMVHALGFSGVAMWGMPDQPSRLARMFDHAGSAWHLSPDRNILILSFDQMQGSVSSGVLRRHPELARRFDGFVAYSDAAAVYPNTRYSIASVLTGRMPQDSTQGWGWAVRGDNFVRVARRRGYAAALAADDLDCDVCVPKGPPAFERRHISRQFGLLLTLAVNQAFGGGEGVVPVLLRPVLERRMGVRALTYSWKIDLGAFRDTVARIRVDAPSPVLEYRHYFATHQPILFDRHCNLFDDDDLAGRQTLTGAGDEVYCVLSSVADLLDTLKAQGIYDRTMIVIASDHGYEASINNSPWDQLARELLFPGSGVTGFHNIKAVGTYNPTLLFKDFDAAGELRVSPRPSSLLDIAATVCESIGGCGEDLDGVSLRASVPADRERRYWRYHGGLTTRFEGGVDRLHDGLDTWWEVRSFRGPVAHALMLSIRIPHGMDALPGVAAGEAIDFRLNGNARSMKIYGWDRGERGGSWTLGRTARLAIPVDGLESPARLVVNARGMAPRRQDRLTLAVSVNGQPVGSYEFRHRSGYRTFAFDLPDDVASPVVVDFEIDEPRSPRQLGLSDDPRLLGVAVRWMKFETIAGDTPDVVRTSADAR